jgi:hypothetical protein
MSFGGKPESLVVELVKSVAEEADHSGCGEKFGCLGGRARLFDFLADDLETLRDTQKRSRHPVHVAVVRVLFELPISDSAVHVNDLDRSELSKTLIVASVGVSPFQA